MDDDGAAVSFLILRRGTPVRTRDGQRIGVVRRVQHNVREHIFDGLVVETDGDGRKVFVDAPEVARIAEKWVTLTIGAAEAAALPDAPSRVAQRLKMSTTVRRTQRSVKRARDRWDNR